uniref:Transcription elongation factor 1 homolog n=1 Tax=Zea mays TaxID=4577 RepID=A0A804N8M3_MAIZE
MCCSERAAAHSPIPILVDLLPLLKEEKKLNHGEEKCRIDMKNLIGEASCRICQENFSTTVNALTEPIDIYSEWIDECERVNTVEGDDDAGCSFIGSSREKENYAAVNQMAAVVPTIQVHSTLKAVSVWRLSFGSLDGTMQLWHLEYRSLVFHKVPFISCAHCWRLRDRDQDCTHHKPISLFFAVYTWVVFVPVVSARRVFFEV